ncbi:MAG: alpha/beta hydrolase [Planctomycetes bacterium]|nr:alpha/beta hydrolase [Planctomycetota bacterium]
MKTHLPFTFRDGLTIDSGEYRERALIELERLRERCGSLKTIIRLETILAEPVSSSDDFEVGSFMSAGGHGIYYNKWKVECPEHVFIFLNGLESHAGWFDEMADEIAGERVRTYGLDRRGSGLNCSSSGKYQDWIDDVKDLATIARNENPVAKMHLVSICFGAKVATACAIQQPGRYDSLIFLSPGLSVKVSPTPKEKLLIGIDKLPRMYFNIRTPIKNDEMFTSQGKALYFLYNDKLRTHSPRAGDFYQARMIDLYISKNLDKVTTPSLALLAGKDRVVNNKKTIKALNKFGQKPKIIEYPESDHVIFFGKSKNEMRRDILNYLQSPA